MKNLNLTEMNLNPLANHELEKTNGGDGVLEWAGELVGKTLYCIYIFGKTAAEYQASLPANLKK
jgi:hypothetical protein